MAAGREILVTADGSHTIRIPATGITYHSTHGAIQESKHVFIEAGLKPVITGRPPRIFELGFGTGLNALLTLQQAIAGGFAAYYYSVEAYPLNEEEYTALNYCSVLEEEALQPVFTAMHAAPWEEDVTVHALFTLHKTTLMPVNLNDKFDVIYFDAFAPNDQPELWEEEMLRKMYSLLNTNGVLVTYCSKGAVRRALTNAGFTVEKLPGPPGKREIVRARRGN